MSEFTQYNLGEEPKTNDFQLEVPEFTDVFQTVGGNTLVSKGNLQSPNYVPDNQGYTLNNDGSAEFQDVVIVGELTATTGVIGGFTIGATTLTGSNLILDSANQRITLGTGNDIVILDADDATYRLWVGNSTAASAPFSVTKAGVLNATGATITGTITATTGSIGGFDIGADYIRDAANSFGLASTVSGSDDVRFWAGDTFTNRATAPFRVYESGAIVATTLDIPDAVTVSIAAPLVRSFTAGENLTAGNSLTVGTNLSYAVASNTTSSTSTVLTTTDWASQSFTTSAGAISIEKVTLNLNAITTPVSRTVRVSLRADSGGQPTGSDLASVDVSCALGLSGADFTFTFASPLSVSASTTYHVVVRQTINTDECAWGRENTGATGANTSASSGSSWSAGNGPYRSAVYEIDTVLGRTYKCEADHATRYNLFGFCRADTTSGNSGEVVLQGIAGSQSGLTAGLPYYVSNTAGAITTSSTAVKAGKAVSATELLITNIW